MERFILIIIVSASIIGCNSPAEKVQDARENVTEANEELEEATDEYLRDIEEYRQEKLEEIIENEQRIAELKASAEYAKPNAKPEYRKKIDELEAENTQLRKQIEEYRGDGENEWETFRDEFNENLRDLGDALKTQVNKKIEL